MKDYEIREALVAGTLRVLRWGHEGRIVVPPEALADAPPPTRLLAAATEHWPVRVWWTDRRHGRRRFTIHSMTTGGAVSLRVMVPAGDYDVSVQPYSNAEHEMYDERRVNRYHIDSDGSYYADEISVGRAVVQGPREVTLVRTYGGFHLKRMDIHDLGLPSDLSNYGPTRLLFDDGSFAYGKPSDRSLDMTVFETPPGSQDARPDTLNLGLFDVAIGRVEDNRMASGSEPVVNITLDGVLRQADRAGLDAMIKREIKRAIDEKGARDFNRYSDSPSLFYRLDEAYPEKPAGAETMETPDGRHWKYRDGRWYEVEATLVPGRALQAPGFGTLISADYAPSERRLMAQAIHARAGEPVANKCDACGESIGDSLIIDGFPAPEPGKFLCRDCYSMSPKIEITRCECGTDAAGGGIHSDWCPKYSGRY